MTKAGRERSASARAAAMPVGSRAEAAQPMERQERRERGMGPTEPEEDSSGDSRPHAPYREKLKEAGGGGMIQLQNVTSGNGNILYAFRTVEEIR